MKRLAAAPRDATEITLRGLRVHGFHGVLPEERERGQDFLIDAHLLVGTPREDDLGQTADYGALAEQLATAVAEDPVDLIETLAQRLVAICLSVPVVQRATVVVHKPSAPIPLSFDDVSVRLTGWASARAVLSLGSNVGDRLAHLQAAVTLLEPDAVSPVYETEPIGGPEQEPYLNAVLIMAAWNPFALWQFTSRIEASRQRERTVRWGPRTLDVDLITVGDKVIESPELVLPHPRAAERAFVLIPWLDVDPSAQLPGAGSVSDLVAGMDTVGVRKTDLELHL